MTTGTRIVVTSLAPGSARVAAWRRHSAEVVGAHAAGPAESSGLAVWHLAASNHRMLARSVVAFTTEEEAALDADRIIACADRPDVVLVRAGSGYALGWFFSLAGAPIAACARWYSTERDRRKSIEAARNGFASGSFSSGREHRAPVQS